MPEIGATLREARMRARIDISEIESETKIRAKYLRALENEEWGLLPGPAYVRSFLRTYAEALGLDAKLLLEEYKLRHERPSDHDLMPIGAPRRRGSRGGATLAPAARRREPRRGVPPGLVILVVVIALLVALYALGKTGGGDGGGDASSTTATTARTSRTTTTTVPRSTTTSSSTRASRKKQQQQRRRAANARLVRLQIVPTGPGPVFVCLEDAGGNRRIPGATLQQGAATGIYRSRSFKVRFGN